MQTVTDTLQPEITIGALAGTFSPPFPDLLQEIRAEIVFSGFGYSLSAPVVEISPAADSQQLTVKVAIDEAVIVACVVKEGRVDGGVETQLEAGIYFESSAGQARALFIASSLQALLCLAGPIHLRIPALRLDAQLNFTAPLQEINQALYARHIAYRLMVIERAFNLKLAVPASISRDDEDRISFVYYAIVERSLVWAFFQGWFPYLATEQARALLNSAAQPGACKLKLSHYDKEVLGTNLALGPATLTFEKAVIVNVEEVRRELERLDGHEFQVLIRSLNGAVKYEFADAPRLPDGKWDRLIEELWGLESQLDETIFQAVNQLAAGSLAGLTEEEIAEVTARPELDEEAFLWAEEEGED